MYRKRFQLFSDFIFAYKLNFDYIIEWVILKKQKKTPTVFTHITIGLQLAITILLFVFGGYWLDMRYDKTPLFIALGAVIGMVFGFYHLIKELNSMEERSKKENSGENRHKSRWM